MSTSLELYPDVYNLLLDLLGRATAILDDSFVGMYLYGSLATDDYVPDRSDLDFVVVTEQPLEAPHVQKLRAMHRELIEDVGKLAKKLEGAYVPRAVIRKHSADQPAVPTINEEEFYLAPLGPDWNIQRYVMRRSDRRLAGPPARELIDPVEVPQITEGILGAMENWWEPMLGDPTRLERPGYQPFAVLTMCRALYAIRHGRLASKELAANWAVDELPGRWERLIREAVQWRDGKDIGSVDETVAFMESIIQMSKRELPYESGEIGNRNFLAHR